MSFVLRINRIANFGNQPSTFFRKKNPTPRPGGLTSQPLTLTSPVVLASPAVLERTGAGLTALSSKLAQASALPLQRVTSRKKGRGVERDIDCFTSKYYTHPRPAGSPRTLEIQRDSLQCGDILHCSNERRALCFPSTFLFRSKAFFIFSPSASRCFDFGSFVHIFLCAVVLDQVHDQHRTDRTYQDKQRPE
jgi:hypothetical protein